MRQDKEQIMITVLEKIRAANEKLTVTTKQVQDAINHCKIPQWLKTALLWFAAISLRKRGVFYFLRAYLVIGAAFIITRPSIWEALINIFFDKNSKVGNALLTAVQFFDGTINKSVFWTLTVVVIIVVTFHFFIKMHENKVHTELKTLIKEITFSPDKDWFENKCSLAIKALGNRFSSDANYRNPRLSNVFKALVAPNNWVLGFRKDLQAYLKACRHQYDKLDKLTKHQNRMIGDSIDEIIEIYNHEQYDKFTILFDKVKSVYQQLYNISKRNKDSISLYDIESLTESFRLIETYSAIYQFLGKPVLYVKGDAGTGKSHFLADIVTTRLQYHLKTLFALGFDFNQNEDVRERLMHIWNVKGTWDDFLVKLDKIGEIEKHRILIIIDGINEGLGNQLWPNVLSGIEADILQYPNLGLIISARSFSQTNMLDEISNGKATLTLEGFRGMEDEAITYLTGKFGVTLPQISRYRKEFSNPLFLKLYCQAYNNAAAPLPNSFLDIVRNYFSKVNEKLAPSYGYQAALYNYTQQISDKLTELYVSQTREQMVKFQKFESLLIEAEAILPDGWAQKYLQDLVSEGVLMTYINKQGETLVDFNFDLVGDYMYAAALINQKWTEYNRRIFDYGIIEATCVLLPLMNGIEIFDFNDSDLSYETRYSLFIYTLKHRFIISNSAIEKIKKIKTIDLDQFYELLPVMASHPECHSIIDMVNLELKDMSMIERDKKWSMHFTINCYDPDKTELLNISMWAASITRESASAINDIVTYQAACVMVWGFSSPFRRLRDVATKGAINLLQDKPNILIRIINLFDDVNDPYIQQRLYAVVHGCVFRGDCGTSVALARRVYEKVFDVETVRPDILLRDYARCAIDYINLHTHIDDIDIAKIEPPYLSKFDFNQCPDRDIVEQMYRLDESKGYSQNAILTQNRILSSMETEYSNGTGGYGDFGRYIFESYLHRWEECKGYSAPMLRNYALSLIFDKYKFDANVYQLHDSIRSYSRGNRPVMERFGKKFQWIALYEILGLLQDNYPMESWVSNNHNVQCEGTWDPHVRDLDTTSTFSNYYNEENTTPREETLEWVHIEDIPLIIKNKKKWLTSKEGMSKELVSNSILMKDNNREEWIVLYGYNTMIQESTTLQVDNEEMGLWEFIQAYLVPRKNRDSVLKLINRRGTQGRNMPEFRNSIYELFYKDYYSSASYREYASRTKFDEWEILGKMGTEYQIAYRPYTCEGEMSVYRLNKILFDILKLKDGKKEGEYVDASGRIIAFDPSVKHQNSGQLLVRKKEMLTALKHNGLCLVWPILIEKQTGIKAIGCQFGGYAYLTEKGKIKVKMRLYKEPRLNSVKRPNNTMWDDYIKLFWYTISFNKVQKNRTLMRIKLSKLSSESARF